MRAPYGLSLLCDAVLLTPVPRLRGRQVYQCTALPYVVSFPPVALPTFIGTTKPSDSLILILPFSLFGWRAYSFLRKADSGSPRLPHNHYVKHATVSDPGEDDGYLPITLPSFSASAFATASPFPFRALRGSIPSTLRLAACLLAVLRMKNAVTSRPPRTCYPVAGLPSGTGVTPARLRNLAWPQLQKAQAKVQSRFCLHMPDHVLVLLCVLTF